MQYSEHTTFRKIVAITGVTKGLGLALTHDFIEKGWHIIGCARSKDEIQKLQRQFGNGHYFESLDISNPHDVKSWVQQSIEKIGIPQIVINNAAIINAGKPLWEINDHEFEKVISINLNGTFFINKYFIQNTLDSKEKKLVIINISSYWGREAGALFSPYCASKYAVEGLTKSLSEEVPSNITVVALDPGGGINTDMLRSCVPEIAANAPMPEQWAKKAYEFIIHITRKDNGQPLTLNTL